MAPDKRRDVLEKSLVVREAAQKRQARTGAGLVVPETADMAGDRVGRSGRGLAEVVADDRKADDQVLSPVARPAPRKCVEAELGVLPDVAFGMPCGILPAADALLQASTVEGRISL